MSVVLLAIRLVLASVFAAAGATKFADREALQPTLVEFGVSSRAAAPLGTILPVVEVVVAIALLPVRTARWAAWVALALLMSFTGAIAVNLAKGREPTCHCFGQWSTAPVGPLTFVGNAILAGLSCLVLQRPRGALAVGKLGRFSEISTHERIGVAAGAAGFGLLTLQGLVIIDLMRQFGRVLRALDLEDFDAPRKSGLLEGSPVPEIRLINVATGDPTTLEELRGGGVPVALVFIQPDCRHCADLLPEVSVWQGQHVGSLTLAVISKGAHDEIEATRMEYGLGLVLSAEGNPVFNEFNIFHTPAMVIIGADGTIRSRTAVGADDIRSLTSTAVTGEQKSADSVEKRQQPSVRAMMDTILSTVRR